MSVLLLTLTENLASPRLCASTSTSPPAAGAETAATPTCAAAAIPVPTPLRNAPSCSPAAPTRPQDPATVARSKVEKQLHNHKPVVSSPIDIKRLEIVKTVKKHSPLLFVVVSLRAPKDWFLHNNEIKRFGKKAFYGLQTLSTLSVTCSNLHRLSFPPHLEFSSVLDCAPSTTFYTIVKDEVAYDLKSFRQSGFICHPCPHSHFLNSMCWNCTFCKDGLKSLDDSCKACPAGGFYQDQMGQITCKHCSIGTYVSIERHPDKRASDCWACPYGTLSNESAGYRACRCLEGFYRLDRFGPCSECPAHGINCVNDTAILAPHYYWKWTNQSNSFFYKNFVQNIHSYEADYNQNYSRFIMPLPKPVKCPYAGSCKGGID
ncbi:uncharacterized protein [Porites lutea]|uniref:uncharacterized protein n=1 Tax=Porites lutea TaxID=51062 RepID=UPI003CC5CE32